MIDGSTPGRLPAAVFVNASMRIRPAPPNPPKAFPGPLPRASIVPPLPAIVPPTSRTAPPHPPPPPLAAPGGGRPQAPAPDVGDVEPSPRAAARTEPRAARRRDDAVGAAP